MIHTLQTTTKTHFFASELLGVSSNSEANASEYLVKSEEMFLMYYMCSDILVCLNIPLHTSMLSSMIGNLMLIARVSNAVSIRFKQ